MTLLEDPSAHRAENAADPAPGPTVPARPGRRLGVLVPALVVLAVAVLVVWKTGPGKVPNIVGFEGIARQWPLYPLQPIEAYVLRQGLGQGLYSWLGWAGTGHYLALHLVALGTAAVALGAWLVRRLGLERGAVAMALLLVSQVGAVLLEWIGMYDAFSVLVWVLLLFALRFHPLAQAAVAVLGGFQNFEQFLVSVVVLALLPEVGRGLGLRARPAALIAGTLVGKIVLELYLRSAGAVNGTRVSFLADTDMQILVLSSFAALAPVIVWSALGSLWLPALRLLPTLWGGASPSLRWRAAAAAVLVLGVGIAGADHTRVMVLVAFPLLVMLCMHLALREETVVGWLRRRETWLMLAIPTVVIVDRSMLPIGLDLSIWGL